MWPMWQYISQYILIIYIFWFLFNSVVKIQEVIKQDLQQNNRVNHNGEIDEEILIANRMKLAQKLNNQKKKVDKQ